MVYQFSMNAQAAGLADASEAPKFQQIARYLTREIAVGRIADGERLPPERELAKRLNTSVGTLRKALGQLAAEGRLERVQGSGNYVRFDAERDPAYSFFRLELARGRGPGRPSAHTVSVKRLKKDRALGCFGSSSEGTRIRRLRCLDDVQVAVEEIWLDGAAGELDATALSDALYRDYQDQLGLQITRATDAVSVRPLPEWSPMEFSSGAAGYVERTAWSAAGESVEFSRTWFDPERAVYVQRLR